MNGMLQHSGYLEVAAQHRQEAEARAHEARLEAMARAARQDDVRQADIRQADIRRTAGRHVRRRPALFRKKARPTVIAHHTAGSRGG